MAIGLREVGTHPDWGTGLEFLTLISEIYNHSDQDHEKVSWYYRQDEVE